MRRFLGLTARDVLDVVRKPIYDNGLHLYMAPPSNFLAAEIIPKSTEGKISSTIEWFANSTAAVFIFLPLVFEAYAYYRCFSVYGIYSIGVWVSLGISLALLLGSLLYISAIATSE